MESKLRNLLDKIYELEGLVHLSLKRGESIDDFLRLIARKGKEVEQLCDSLQPESRDNVTGIQQNAENDMAPEAFGNEGYVLEEEEISFPEEYAIEDEDKIESRKDESRGKLIFSINDRYRFRHQLFNDSDPEFNNTLVLVASMDDYDEAEDYFLNEQGWDPTNANVRDFLSMIKRYFK